MKCALAGFLTCALAIAPHAQARAAPDGPEGVEWQLRETGGEPVGILPGERQPYILLDASRKRAKGYTGCNGFFGSYELAGTTLRFGPVGATRRICPEIDPTLETKFLDALARTREWKIHDSELLFLDNDRVLARFARQRVVADAGIESLTFRSAVLTTGPVTLTAGEYRAPAAPGSASEVSARLTDKRAFASVSGRRVGAAVIATSAGGSGSFSELALLSKRPDGWANTDTVLLGDRVKVNSLAIQNGMVVVRLMVHGPKDPMCCPALAVEKRFLIQDNRLVPVSASAAPTSPIITDVVWRWVKTLYNDDRIVVPAKPDHYTIRFLQDGTIDVRADCNRKGGTYSAAGKTLSISITYSTMAACEPGSLEEQFVRDLSAVSIYFFRDGDLYFDLRYDSGTMHLSPTPE
jgi:heat shock protein HslJ